MGGTRVLRGALVLILVASLAGCDWTTFRYGPERTGYNPTESVISTANVADLELRWTGSVTLPYAHIYASPVITGGTAYVGSDDGVLYAFDAAGVTGCSGTPKTCDPSWTAPIGKPIIASAAVVGGVAYVAGYSDFGSDGAFYAFDAAGQTNCSGAPKTCQPLWAATVPSVGGSSPTVANGVVFIGSARGDLYAFDAAGNVNCSGSPKTCEPLWTAAVGVLDSSPAVSNGVVYVGSYGGDLVALDAAGSTNCSGVPRVCLPLWRGHTGGLISSTPAVSGGRVYIGSWDGSVYVFDAAGTVGCNGSPKVCDALWTAPMGDEIDTSPAVAGGILYVGASNGTLAAFDASGTQSCAGAPKSCSPLWSSTLQMPGHALGSSDSPSVANGVVYVGTAAQQLFAFDALGNIGCSGTPRTCAPLWSHKLGSRETGASSSPAIANGVLYAGSTDGHLFAFGL